MTRACGNFTIPPRALDANRDSTALVDRGINPVRFRSWLGHDAAVGQPTPGKIGVPT
jgi:hypothetical protein